MKTGVGGGELHRQLKNLCVNTDWKYAVFWKLNHQAQMMLSCEDAYCNNNEEHGRSVSNWFDSINDNFKDEEFSQDLLELAIAKMSYRVYSIGEGIIGRVAARSKHLWISGHQIVDSSCSLDEVINSSDMPVVSILMDGKRSLQPESSFGFLYVLHTVVIVVVPYGVVQLGSLNTIAEDLKLVNHIREIFLDLQSSSMACYPCVTDISTNRQESENQISDFVQFVPCNDQNKKKFPSSFSNGEIPNNSETETIESYSFPAGCELYEALGPVFRKQKNNISWEKVTTKTLKVSQMPQESSNNSLVTQVSGSENLLEAVVAKSAKVGEKRVRNDESRKPRPRDRQLIQDRIKELRQLVPNGSKCSIDSLLERTIKHMLFMQCTTKHADKIDKCSEFKLLDTKAGVKRHSSNEQGTSWTMEVGNGLNVCPIIVENIGIDGQLLVEMMCDENVHFLEITEAIRSLGLTILKGVTNAYNGDKTWMCFVVELPNMKPIPPRPERSLPQESSNNSLVTQVSGSENLLEAVVAKSAKVGKKRVRNDESRKPRPRDRQLIQDRIKELRQLVPNGSKCSIDSLLERTIKHMLFMQCTTKHADKIDKCSEFKLLDNKARVKRHSGNKQGKSWAMEVGNGLNVCPIIVENIGIDGQLLVEMMCDENVHFLEITEAIRSLGLTILKGVTNAYNGDKTWMCFVVEGRDNRSVHRIDILMSLIQILELNTKI